MDTDRSDKEKSFGEASLPFSKLDSGLSLLSAISDFTPLILGKRYLRSSEPAPSKKTKLALSLSRTWKTIRNNFAAILVLLALASGIATYGAMSEIPPFGNNPDLLFWLLNIDMGILLLFVVLIAKRVVSILSGRKRGLAGSHLQVRLVSIFSLMAAIPAIILTVFSAFFFHYGIQAWFSQRVQTAINESQAVAQAYLEEHQQVIRADTLAMANDLDRQFTFFIANNEALEKIVETQSVLRNFSEVLVFQEPGEILARSKLTFSLEFDDIPTFAMENAQNGDVVILTNNDDDRVRALLKLNNFTNTYLYVGRRIDPQVLSHVADTKQAVEDYASLQTRYTDLQITATLIFVVVSLLMVFAAIWFGLVLSRQLVRPIGSLITATERVRGGDLSVRVNEEKSLKEFDHLGRAFNRMTRQIEEQQSELIGANRLLDQRRRFTETVLSGVSSGVLGLDQDGIVNLANNSAIKLLGKPEDEVVDHPIMQIFPDIDTLLVKANERAGKITQGEIHLNEENGEKRIFLLRVASENLDDQNQGAIITFDDITELQSAQRKAAWADVARRIAHEIKNPLTPIQLSAERLQRKYKHQIDKDQDIFTQCIETIIRHVGDIGHMVDEFSAFARMPEPNRKKGNLLKHIEDSTLLQRQARPDVSLNIDAQVADPMAVFDAQQIRQVLTNLVQNSIDAIDEKCEKNPETQEKQGHIEILLHDSQSDIIVTVYDNGAGFPDDHSLGQLTEPYVTHKKKGTGLGLAIVKKIMEDHGGKIVLGPIKEKPDAHGLGGAMLSLYFPKETT